MDLLSYIDKDYTLIDFIQMKNNWLFVAFKFQIWYFRRVVYTNWPFVAF